MRERLEDQGMAGKRRALRITLTGRPVHYTDRAVKWLDDATGFELWFPLSRSKIDGNRIEVPEAMYRGKVREWQREEKELERQNKIDDRQIEADYQQDVAEIERKYGPTKPKGCLGVLMLLASALAVLTFGMR